MEKKPSIQFYEKIENYDEFADEHEYAAPEKLLSFLIPYLKNHKTLLDIGIGSGLASIKLADFGLEIYGVDGSKNLIEMCKEKNFTKKVVLHDLSSGVLPYFNSTFDVIISSGVFEFVLDLDKMFKNVKNVLNENGLFCFCIRELGKNPHIETIEVNGRLIDKNAYKNHGIVCIHYSEKEIDEVLFENKFEILLKDSFRSYFSPTNKNHMFNVIYLCKEINEYND